jgi:3-dehydroquinate synthase
MQVTKLNLAERSYDIVVGKGVITFLGGYIKKLELGDSAYVITNSALRKRYGLRLERLLQQAGLEVKFRLIPDSEKSKSFSQLITAIEDISNFDKNRRVFILAFGGGVIGDLAGFVAAVYKRGISYVQVPTTLLAQVDSAIGGKTAVDLAQGKNLAGAFYQPRLVLSDVRLLRSLKPREMRSGLAEVIKYALIKDKELFNYLEKNYPAVLRKDYSVLQHIISRSSWIKAAVVSRDEQETRNLRTLLNFGHTIAHALENALGYRGLTHGEAVALGMLVACGISVRLAKLKSRDAARIEGLISKVGLPVKISGLSLAKVIQAHYHDKKFIGAENRFVLLRGIGKAEVVSNVALKVIREALKERIIV